MPYTVGCDTQKKNPEKINDILGQRHIGKPMLQIGLAKKQDQSKSNMWQEYQSDTPIYPNMILQFAIIPRKKWQ